MRICILASMGALLLAGCSGGDASSGSSSTGASTLGSGASSSGGGTTGSGSTTGTSTTSGSGSSGSASGSSGTSGAVTLGETLDPTRVYFVGTFDPPYCGSDLLASAERDPATAVGFPCNDTSFRMRPDGRVLYLFSDQSGSNTLRLFSADAWLPDGGGYPADPTANDAVIATSACDAYGGPTAYALSPDDGSVIFNCPPTDDWFDVSGALRFSNVSLHGLGSAGHALVTNLSSGALEVRDAQDQGQAVTGFVRDASTDISTYRSQPSGFWMAVDEGGARSLWQIDLQGAATQIAAFPALTAQSATGALDAAGDLYVVAADPRDGSTPALFRLTRDGAAPELVTSVLDAPPDDLTASPPRVYPQIHAVSGHLFSGP